MRNNLKTARQEQNLTQEKLAKMLGITARQYRQIESGDSDGSIKVWVKQL